MQRPRSQETSADSSTQTTGSDAKGAAGKLPPDRVGYWKANVRLIAALLCVWAAVSYGCSIFFIEQLNAFTIGGLPLGFWFAQQGSMYVFVVLILIYAVRMDRLDRKYGVRQEEM